MSGNFKRRVVITLDFGETVQVGAQDIAAQGQIHELAVAGDLEQAGCFQLLDVMRESGGAHIVGFLHAAAGTWLGAGADLLEDLIAAWLGERVRDPGELPIRQASRAGGGHGVNSIDATAS